MIAPEHHELVHRRRRRGVDARLPDQEHLGLEDSQVEIDAHKDEAKDGNVEDKYDENVEEDDETVVEDGGGVAYRLHSGIPGWHAKGIGMRRFFFFFF